MPIINTTDSRYIKNLDCNPTKQKKIIFEGSSLKIISGSQVLDTTDMSNLSHFASEEGGSLKKTIFLPSGKTYNLRAGNIAQDQGEVSLIIIKVKYDSSLTDSEKYIIWEYNGKTFPCKNLLFLTGRTLEHQKYHGWDLEPFTGVSPNPSFSPALDPIPTSPDLSFGGIIISNTTLKEIELEILIMN